MQNIVDNKYNNTEHNTIKIKPNEAKSYQNHLWVNWHLQRNAKQRTSILKLMRVIVLELILRKVSLLKDTSQTGHQQGIK